MTLPWFPEGASSISPSVDGLLGFLLGFSLLFAVLVHGMLLVALIRFRRRPGVGPRPPWTAPWIKWVATGVPAVILAGFAVASQSVWTQLRDKGPQVGEGDTIEVLAQQYAWNIRYPGPDGKFGKLDPRLVSDDDPWGRVREDAAGKDDVITLNELHMVTGKPVRIRLRSRDVIHSFFVPEFRFKRDAVPGMVADIRFTPTRAGDFEIACAEFCGLAHYRMKGTLRVESDQEFKAWLREKAEE